MASGPLNGVRIVEMAAIGPAPFACMLLSDLGAEVIRVDRVSGNHSGDFHTADIMSRGRKSIAVDLKNPEGVKAVLALIDTADILIEGFRPGVMEKLGLGPKVCHARNKQLIYGRMTGWGQHGPLSQAAGHDINYIAITGALDAIGTKESGPVPPLNLLGDFAGGSMYLVMGVLAAYIHAQQTHIGQVVDTAITDGTISLMSFVHGFHAMGLWDYQRAANMTDSGAHYYDCYECADGLYVSIGAIEPQFYALLIELTGVDLSSANFLSQFDKSTWTEKKAKLEALFKTKTRQQWTELLEGTDACFGPVLNTPEAAKHPHNIARGSFVEIDGVLQSAPAPRFSHTPAAIQGTPVAIGQDTLSILAELGIEAKALLESGTVSTP